MEQWLFAPKDPLALQLFRIIFGTTVAYYFVEKWSSGVLEARFLEAQFFFVHFSWLKPLSDAGFRCLFLALILAGITLGAGIWSRFSALVVFLGFSYVWLLEKAHYNNHYYFISLVALLFLVTGVTNERKEVPFWKLGIFRFQVLVVYLFAGVAKMHADWFGAVPISVWFGSRARRWDLSWFESEPVVFLASHGAMYLDLFAPVFLLWPPGRWVYVPLLIGFHLANSILFSIGVFPYLMLGTLVLFVNLGPLQRRLNPPKAVSLPAERQVVLVCLFLVLYSSFQILFPLRHYFVPGDANWTSESHWFAWRMMLRSRSTYGCQFYLERPGEGRIRLLDAGSDLSSKQYKDMVKTPHMLAQYAQHLAKVHEGTIYVRNHVSMNQRPAQTLVDPKVGFTAAGPTHPNYILPLGLRIQPLEIPAWVVRWHGSVFLLLGSLAWASSRSPARLFLLISFAPAFLFLNVTWLWLGLLTVFGLVVFDGLQKRFLSQLFWGAALVPIGIALVLLTGADFSVMR